MARCFSILVGGASKGFEADIAGERECVAGTVTPCVAVDELAGGLSRDWGGGTRPSTCSDFGMSEFRVRTSLLEGFALSYFDNLGQLQCQCRRLDATL